ncbi:hypothetical protein EG329_001489 [Mollisiaceae sp. DMI_Dod_QoI]|nr:hypothetical protein EG329_001489 [Helotiales sp. DMI_Dod_QoI]
MTQNASGDAQSSVADSADATNPAVLSRASTKRKYGHKVHKLEHGPKRQRVMGRPRNGWSPTRLRKLVRLYLMTNLDVIEISKVLRSKDFKPCKRDVQEQLKSLLQNRPDKIRARGRTTKTRLQVLRECKRMRKERQQLVQQDDTIQEVDVADTTGLAISSHETTPSVPESSKGDWSWLDLGLNDSISLALDNAPNIDMWYSESGFVAAKSGLLPPPPDDDSVGIGLAIPLLEPYELFPELDNWTTDLDSFTFPPSITDLPLLNADPSLSEASIYLSQSYTTSESPRLSSPRPDSPTVEVKIALSHAGSDALQNFMDNPSSNREFDFGSMDGTGQYAASVFGPGGKSSRASVLTISSLRKRLSLKYSDSYLADILSLMQNLTIAGSSAISSRGTASRMSKALSATVTSHFETAPPLPSLDEMPSIHGIEKSIPRPRKTSHLVILPGAFPTYCWAQINENKLRPCRHDALLSSHIPIPTSRDNLGYTIREQLEQAGCDKHIIQGLFAAAREPKYDQNHCLPNYGVNTAIETVEDLTLYAQHAELLRDIRTSLNNSLHEDAKGRNGLHCLAEVSLDLPIPKDLVSSEHENTLPTPQTQRERYLEGLLKSRVDANNHDKQGLTPLMAFIIHRRAGEDDALTTRLLQLLVDAGAGVNIRNRQGETALHLAVKLGRRAATKFLLSHGANVHARDGYGLGVMALGEVASKKAKHDEALYAQIILCVSLVVNAGGISTPTILQEWGSPKWKIFDG